MWTIQSNTYMLLIYIYIDIYHICMFVSPKNDETNSFLPCKGTQVLRTHHDHTLAKGQKRHGRMSWEKGIRGGLLERKLKLWNKKHFPIYIMFFSSLIYVACTYNSFPFGEFWRQVVSPPGSWYRACLLSAWNGPSLSVFFLNVVLCKRGSLDIHHRSYKIHKHFFFWAICLV